MNPSAFKQFCTTADDGGVIFFYDGEISQTVIGTMAESVKRRMEESQAERAVTQRIFSSFVELVMNVLHYSPAGECGARGKILVGAEGGRYYIICGNTMLTEHVDRLRGKLEPVTRMTSEEIRKAYRAQLRNEDHESDGISKGAGLGILTVARDASEPIQFDFDPVTASPQLTHFILKVTF